MGDFAWFYGNSNRKNPYRGSEKPNAFGVYRMGRQYLGVVQDCYEVNYKQAPKNGSAWEQQDCAYRVLRGGSWNDELDTLRSAYRNWKDPSDRSYDIGFRLAQD